MTAKARTTLSLTRDEVRRGIAEYEDLIHYIEARRSKERMAVLLQFPKLPNRLTECFVGELVADRTLLPELSATEVIAGHGSDLTLHHPAGVASVEVKGTAQSFTMFSQKDLDADYLVWVDFGVSFRLAREVGIHVVEHLRRIGINANAKMTLPEFLRRTAAIRDSLTYDWTLF